MGRLFTWLLVTLSVGGAATIAATHGGLPPRVATHFGAGGAANGWMTRDGYLAFMLVFVLGLPWFVYASVAVLPRLFPRFANLPHRDYWLSPARQGETLTILRTFGAGIAILMTLAITGAHFALLEANALQPARLAEGPFIAGVVLFAAAIVAMAIVFTRRFRRVPPGTGHA